MKQDFQHIDKLQQKQGKQQENKQINGKRKTQTFLDGIHAKQKV